MLTSVVLALTLITAPDTVGIVAPRHPDGALRDGGGPRRTAHPGGVPVQEAGPAAPGAPAHLEDPQPPRFAQGVGLVFALVGLVGYLSGVTLLGAIATGFALAAALLNAVFGFCLGCEMYLLLRRVAPARTSPPVHSNA